MTAKNRKIATGALNTIGHPVREGDVDIVEKALDEAEYRGALISFGKEVFLKETCLAQEEEIAVLKKQVYEAEERGIRRVADELEEMAYDIDDEVSKINIEMCVAYIRLHLIPATEGK